MGLFGQEDVRYLLVGGHAVSIYTTPRYTKDLDLWLERTSENALRVLRALDHFGFGSLQLTEDDFTEPEAVIQLGIEPVRIDLLTDLQGMDFEDCWKRRTVIDLGGREVYLIALSDLIRNKESAGRSQDLTDAEQLRRRLREQ